MERTPAGKFQDLVVWQKAHALVLDVYRMTSKYPKSELFCLSSQMRKSAISVPANIAEGFKKRSRLDKARFMNVAEASLEELRYYLILSRDLGYVQEVPATTLADEVARMLGAYSRTLLSPVS
jgi:four helix bundle protein